MTKYNLNNYSIEELYNLIKITANFLNLNLTENEYFSNGFGDGISIQIETPNDRTYERLQVRILYDKQIENVVKQNLIETYKKLCLL